MNDLRQAEEFLKKAESLSRHSADPAIHAVQRRRNGIRAELVRLGKEKEVLAQAEKTRRDSEPPGGPGLSAKDFVGVRTMNEAVQIVKQDLIGKGKAEYAALLSEERVRGA